MPALVARSLSGRTPEMNNNNEPASQPAQLQNRQHQRNVYKLFAFYSIPIRHMSAEQIDRVRDTPTVRDPNEQRKAINVGSHIKGMRFLSHEGLLGRPRHQGVRVSQEHQSLMREHLLSFGKKIPSRISARSVSTCKRCFARSRFLCVRLPECCAPV